MLRAFLLALAMVALLACDNTGTISFRTGELSFEVSATSLELPPELREDSAMGATIRELPCPTGECPSTADISVSCDSMVCNPAPTTLVIPVGDVIDFDMGDPTSGSGSAIDTLLGEVDAIEVREASYDVVMNTLTVDIGEVEILWGPEGAATGDWVLGTVPPLAAGAVGSGQAVMNPEGQQRLSDYLVGTSRRIRLFVRTLVDLEPNGAFPEGELSVTAVLQVAASGRLID